MADDCIAWNGPSCPDCGGELDVEPIAAGGVLRVAYTCPTHGLVQLADPFPRSSVS